jgi:Tol biopolymer transport system component
MPRSCLRQRVYLPFLPLVLAGCAAAPAEPVAPGGDVRPTGDAPPQPAGPYLGQRAGDAPALFAPGVISRRYGEMNAAFSPDGMELYFTLKDAADRASTILVTRRVDGRWQPPRVASFSGRYDDVDPMFSPDGTRLYFSSYRPRQPGAAPASDADIWYVERRGGAFGEAVHVGAPVSTAHDDFYPSLTRDGTLYYSVWDGQRRTGDIFRARLVNGAYQVESLGAPINTESTEYDPFVAPDESYVIFASTRPGGHGDSDLYVSFRDGTSWSAPANLGAAINSSAREYCPAISPDGEYFFFTSKRAAQTGSSGGMPATSTVKEWTARYDLIENGLGNVYWLRSDFLRDLRAASPPFRVVFSGAEHQ